MRKRIVNIILTLVLLAGLSLLLYPTVADWWNQYHQSRAIAGYTELVDEIDNAEAEEIIAEARKYNQLLPTIPNRYYPSPEDHELYLQTLDITGTGIMGYIEIPSINVSLPIYHGADDAVLQIAVGHIEGTSLPVGGEGTHCVLSGHRGLPSARLFTDLDKLEVGDVFMVRVLHETLTYQIDSIVIVEPEDVNGLEFEQGQDLCTLVTCTPYGVNTHRMLLTGRRIDNAPEEAALVVDADAEQIEPLLVAAGLAAPVLLVMLGVVVFGGRKKRS